MQLIYSPTSPFVRKVTVLLREADMLDSVEMVPVQTSPVATDPKVAAANPLGRIPALLRDEGPAIYDSRVITRYLDVKAGGKFYPEQRIWEVLTLEATAEGILDSAVSMAYELKVRPPEKVFDGWLDAQWGKISGALSAINSRWMSHLNGPLDMSHIAVGCALGYLDLRHDARGWRKGNDALDDWYAVFAERPSMQATIPVA